MRRAIVFGASLAGLAATAAAQTSPGEPPTSAPPVLLGALPPAQTATQTAAAAPALPQVFYPEPIQGAAPAPDAAPQQVAVLPVVVYPAYVGDDWPDWFLPAAYAGAGVGGAWGGAFHQAAATWPSRAALFGLTGWGHHGFTYGSSGHGSSHGSHGGGGGHR